VFDQLEKISFESLIDIGCGDGRFMRELNYKYPNVKTLGIDYSERAIGLAQSLNPNINFKVKNVINQSTNEKFDAAVLIEVLEHIPPNKISEFLCGVKRTLKNGGNIVLTVPHKNNRLPEKHYQHFQSEDLRKLFKFEFEVLKIIPFDTASSKLPLWQRLPRSIFRRILGGKGKHFIVTNSWLNKRFFELYKRKYLYNTKEKRCARLCAVIEVK